MVEESIANADAGSTAELDKALRTFGEAWAKGDADALRSLLSPRYTHNDASGEHLTCDQWVAYAARRAGRATQIKFRDVKTRLFGDLAIITGFNDLTGGGVFNEADRRDMSLVFLQVWRRENGRWLREAFQATPVMAEGYS